MTPVDLITPTQDALFLALEAEFDASEAQVLQHVLQDTKPAPPLIVLGKIEADNDSSKDDQAEQLECEVHVIYRGRDRRVLIGLAHRVRGAIDRQKIGALTDDATLHAPHWLGTTISDAAEDGVTYVALLTFTILAEPA